MNSRPIQIVGGGLAGLSLGLCLRRESLSVVVHEAGAYPRHRVCGEFLSGRGIEFLRSLGILERIVSEGGRWAESAAFFSVESLLCHRRLPQPALCVSRFVLDELLARALREEGGEVIERSRCGSSGLGPGTVRATGRASARPAARDSRWFGVKAHARSVQLSADLEMHLVPGGYVGLCRLSGDRVNACGLLRKAPGMIASSVCDWLRGVPGSLLRKKLEMAEFDEDSICTISGLDLRPKRSEAGEPSVGDALTMIAPISGNGMSLALESSQIAASEIAAFGRGTCSWEAARKQTASRLDRAFRRRLFWASWLQSRVAGSESTNPRWLGLLRWPGVWRLGFWLTR